MAEILIEVCPTCEAPLSLCGCEELARAEEPHGPMPAAFPEFCRVLGCKTLKDEDAQEIWNAPDRDLREVIAWDLATQTYRELL